MAPEYEDLLAFNAALHQDLDLEQPSLRFTKNVMEEITRYHIAPAAKTYINRKIIYGIAAFFFTIIIGSVIYAIGQVDWSAGGGGDGAFSYDFSRFISAKHSTINSSTPLSLSM